jgi:hypothetical protein
MPGLLMRVSESWPHSLSPSRRSEPVVGRVDVEFTAIATGPPLLAAIADGTTNQCVAVDTCIESCTFWGVVGQGFARI